MSDTKAVEQYIEEIRNRLANITPGPWVVETDGTRVWHRGSGGTICEVNFDHQTGDHQPGEDQAFIANAPSDIAFLLEQLASIRSQIEAAVQAEREACAVIADEELEYFVGHPQGNTRIAPERIRRRIRSRGEAPSTPNQSEQ